MKLFVKLMLALLVLAVLLPFTVLKNKEGSTLMSFSDFSLPKFSMPDLPNLSSSGDLLPAGGASGGMTTFYKWYDSRGNVQFTTEPPAAGVEYTVKQFDPNANLLQAVEVPVEVEQDTATELQNGQEKASQGQATAYDPESIKKLFDDAKNVQELLNQRTNIQNDINN